MRNFMEPLTTLHDTPETLILSRLKGFPGKTACYFQNLLTGENEASTLPKSNVLYYNLDDRAWLCVRPSGTEPKIKFYMGVKADSLEKAVEKTDALVASVDELLKKIL